jgi:pimeloyl-ACP methyl ester carboxylesterase
MEANPAPIRATVPNFAADPTPLWPMPENYLARMNKLLTVVAALALVALPACGHAKPRQHVDTRISPVLVDGGQLVDVGGRTLYLECVGSGSPTVILEAGFGGSSIDWRDVQPQLGRTTRTCAYDRAGLGSSVAMPGVHDADDEARDLHQLLFSARIPPPYVLVGHSYGGLLTRLYAYEHPRDVAGMVLVDAMGRNMTARQLAVWPRSVNRDLRQEAAQPVFNGVDVRSGEQLDDRVRTLGGLPLVVIAAGMHRGLFGALAPSLQRALGRLWARMQMELAGLSSDHVLVLARRSDHVVQRLDGQPQVVLRAVRAVVRAARDKTRLERCAHLFAGPAVRCLGG